MNKRHIKLFTVALIGTAVSFFNSYAYTSQSKSTQIMESVASQKQSQESTDWFLVRSILNDKTQEIKQAVQKDVPDEELVEKQESVKEDNSFASQKQSQESKDWFLVKAILNDKTQEIKQAIQKDVPAEELVGKQESVKEDNSLILADKETTSSKANFKNVFLVQKPKNTEKAEQTSINNRSMFNVVGSKFIGVFRAVLKTGSKIKLSIWGFFRG